MKKILHIVEAFGGGVVTYLEILSREQCEMGNEVVIAYGEREETPVDFRTYFHPNIQWVKVKNFQRSIGMHDVKAMCEISAICKSTKPDIVHSHSSKAGVLTRLLFLFNGSIKQFYTPHSYSFLMTNISRNKQRFYYIIEKVAALCSRATTIGCGYSEYLEAKKLGGRCTYVNNGVQPTLYDMYKPAHEPNTKAPVVGIVARILSQKNPQFFNKSAELLPDVKFKWIGDGLLHSCLTAKNIEITGWNSKHDAMKHLKDIDVFLQPSKWEGLSMSLLEAMAMKKLCIVSDIESMREIIQNGVNGFVCNSPEDVEKIIRQLQNGEIDYTTITEAAHQTIVDKYHAKGMASQYQKIYDSEKK